MMATNSPAAIVRLTSRSACTSTSPTRYVRDTCSRRMIGSGTAVTALQPRARQRGLGRAALLGGDDEVAGLEIAGNDFGEAVVVEAGRDRDRDRFIAAQHEDTALDIGAARAASAAGRSLARRRVAQRLARHP